MWCLGLHYLHPMKYTPLLLFCLLACDKDEPATGSLTFKFKFDNQQIRLNNFGQPSSVASDHGAQSPRFHAISAHYIELTESEHTPLGQGVILYKNEETTAGGDKAIDFSKSIIVTEDEVFLTVDLSKVPAGDYKYIRVSLAYQNYDIDILANGFVTQGTLASFVGFNTYVTKFKIGQQQVELNANRKQGYWAFESPAGVLQGQAPEGATTVPNPIASTSPIPPGSCVVTGQFDQPLVISADDVSNISITLSLSINNSFEWMEVNADNKFEPLAGESVVDMGLRGLVPMIERH